MVRVWRRFKRDLALLLTQQFWFLRPHIPNQASRVLYVYLGTPQLGDSIMDLSSRQLWSTRALRVDMLTHPSISAMYQGDPAFDRVFDDRRQLRHDYDFVVLQSYSWKCLKVKWRYFFFKQFLSLHGHYFGCEFNRLEFANDAWRAAFCMPADAAPGQPESVFRLSLDHSEQTREPKTIALGIGGVVPWRTYPHWAAVLHFLKIQYPEIQWILLGTANGRDMAQEIARSFSGDEKSLNLVDALPLDHVFARLQRVTLLLTADGGLLHLGKAAKVPIVALFAGAIHPRMRFCESDAAHVIHARAGVSDIPAERIACIVQQCVEQHLESLHTSYLNDEPNCSVQ